MSKQNTFLGKNEILAAMSKPGAKVHFVGVGGVGMSSLFCLTRHFGIGACGSDKKCSDFVNCAIEAGEEVYVGECADAASGADLVVYSLAVGEDSPELLAAEERGIPTVSRADYMSALSSLYSKTVAVSGSHGKSTVTAMLYSIFKEAKKEPTVLCGAEFSTVGQDVFRLGIGSLDYLIFESCEYKDSFLAFSPDVALFLNLELDHTDYFKDLEHIKRSFSRAIAKTGLAIINGDDENLPTIEAPESVKRVYYGEGEACDYRYSLTSFCCGMPRFLIFHRGHELAEVSLCCIGRHNAANATAAIACAMEMGIPFSACKRGIESFLGAMRRLQLIGKWQGRSVYYDYAHHPTEIRCGIEAIRDMGCDKVTVIFCAHTYSRTEALLADFVSSLALADHVILTEIDAVREKGGNITSSGFAAAVGGALVKDEEALHSALLRTEGAILLMGAGDNDWVKTFLLKC